MENILKNSKVVLFVTLKSWLNRKILDPTTYTVVPAEEVLIFSKTVPGETNYGT
jgi:hypothetical protein